MSIIRASAWRSSAGCSKPKSSGSASSRNPTGSRPSHSRRWASRPCSSASPAATWTRWSIATRRTVGCATTTPTRPPERAAGGPAPSPSALPHAAGGRSRTCRSCSAASLRRIAHFDYWSEKVRRSVLADAKADLLLYGNAERAVVEVANRIAAGETARELDDIRGVALFRRVPEDYAELHADDLDSADEGAARNPGATVIRLPALDQVEQDRDAYARASRVLHRESN